MKKILYIKNAFLNSPIEKAQVSLISHKGQILDIIYSDKNGKLEIDLLPDISYILIEKETYVSKKISLLDNNISLIRLIENEIIGYINSVSFNPGDSFPVYVHSITEYYVELIRHGITNEVIENIGTFQSCIQEVPDEFFVEFGLNWKVSFDYQLSETLKPGLYSLKLTPCSLNSLKPYYLTFGITTNKKYYGINSKLLVLLSSNNWQTYNIWGGRSRYRNFEHFNAPKKHDSLRHLWIKYTPDFVKNKTKRILRKKFPITIKDAPNNFQFKRLSIKRPHPNCSIEDDLPNRNFTSHLAASEWRLLAWLEKNGLEYDLVSGFELHKDPALLNNYSILILNSHSEYWSKQMFSGLKNFFYSGGSIINLSGNSIYREVEFYEDGSLRCVSLNFSETVSDESEIIGVRFTMKGYGTCAPYKVLMPNHWVFEGLNLKKGDTFGAQSLNRPQPENDKKFESDPSSSPGLARLTGQGASGWETDKLSRTSPKDILLVAKGLNPHNGGADMIVREKTDKHGLLFSVSSITFVGSLLVDEVCSRIVNNVIKKILDN